MCGCEAHWNADAACTCTCPPEEHRAAAWQPSELLPRLFALERAVDVSGISGTGTVAYGVQFPDGRVATRWNGDVAQTCVWDSIGDVERIHGHDGATVVRWLDHGAAPDPEGWTPSHRPAQHDDATTEPGEALVDLGDNH